MIKIYFKSIQLTTFINLRYYNYVHYLRRLIHDKSEIDQTSFSVRNVCCVSRQFSTIYSMQILRGEGTHYHGLPNLFLPLIVAAGELRYGVPVPWVATPPGSV